MLSTVVHLGVVGFTLCGDIWSDSAAVPIPQRETNVMTVGLYAPDNTAQSRPAMLALSEDEQLAVESVSPEDTADATAREKDEAADIPARAKSTDAIYFPATELTKLPTVMLDIPADFSLPAANGADRLAVLWLSINEKGDVAQVTVEDASVSEQEQDVLKDVFSKMKFHAGEINGLPIKSQLKIEVILNQT